ncbi:COMM domain-containing protein 3 [Sitodiplosis mosellana]|uniref:COMM domain-containing protein 3 n=1 Tax=Sitodiplosis mosellana TaxID=263140 RepID=UPI0024453074|nr:COMM domain-containing protein 3 [Sitodiplosis mosellana]
MSKIELSNIVIEGLKSLNTVISSDLTKKIISNAVKMALHSDANIPSNPEIYATTPVYTKQAEYAVLTLMFLAIKYDLDNAKLRELLEEHGISDVATEELISVYEKNQTSLRIQNLTTGLSVPHVTNVEWKLTCDVKSSQIDSTTGALNFRINFGRYKELSGERETITEFVCNAEELQFLIGRLKEIERHCEQVGMAK